MAKRDKKRILVDILGVVIFIAAFGLLLLIPFKRNPGEEYISVESPIIPWYEIIERRKPIEMEKPANEPIIGEWNWPSYIEERVWVISGKEYVVETYLVYPDGQKTAS